MTALARTAAGTDRRDLSGPGLRAFFNIAAQWRLSNEQVSP